ncbi:2-keto-4-pentenoate hydratase [Cupriavidus basilensis]|uniref:2-keto-4-pentenoate hydratase n=1 Tax=Cupriavidus basilensis TaxID=68895 RepID=A0A0C4Y0L9_9BURK|nr:fumarylacetoacetate hydrolase family protein [Cupriavidus basilensis]AJG18462.1 2-keto-4-pentenoate hydratase [Cupriavidus basilensis]
MTNEIQQPSNADAAIRAAADLLWQAHAGHAPCLPVRTLIGETDPRAAYQVQEINTQRWLAAGRRLVGRKIGLTSRAVQQQLGVGEPDFGMLFADMAVAEGEEIDLRRVLQPRIEAEIALVLAHPLAHERHTIADLIRATAYALPAAEIVGSRVANWDIRLNDTIADNASSGLFALGSRPVKLADLDLIGCGMAMERRGEQVSLGAGAACLGNPLHAALWLADTMVRVGRPLQAGDIVMTGALGPMVPVAAGDVFDLEIEGLGRLSTRFAPANKEPSA